MKKTSKRKLFRLGIAVAFCFAIISVLEIFDLHPHFSIGNFHAVWAGVRHMELDTGTMTIHLTNGRTEIQKICDVGPVKMVVVYD
jgi:hypothetical protein